MEILVGALVVVYAVYKLLAFFSKAAKEHAARPRPPKKVRYVPPPLPTDEQKAASALSRYVATLRWLARAGLEAQELEAAKKKAKQQYLRDIDELMK